MLVRLLYASRAVDPSSEAIDAILVQSRQYNPTCGITGILCYGGGIFLQAIEGGRMPVSELYGHIQKDARHKDGRLRLMYEANPMAFIVEQAGGAATDGHRRIMDLEPNALHQRVPVILGSRNEVERLTSYHA